MITMIEKKAFIIKPQESTPPLILLFYLCEREVNIATHKHVKGCDEDEDDENKREEKLTWFMSSWMICYSIYADERWISIIRSVVVVVMLHEWRALNFYVRLLTFLILSLHFSQGKICIIVDDDKLYNRYALILININIFRSHKVTEKRL